MDHPEGTIKTGSPMAPELDDEIVVSASLR